MSYPRIFPYFLFAVIALAFTQSSCVSKKKFIAELSTRDSTLTILNTRIISLNREIAQRELDIADKTGENRALYAIHDKHEERIMSLEKEIENLISKSLTQQQMADVMLQQKREEVVEKEEFIHSLNIAVEKQERAMQVLSDSIRKALAGIPSSEIFTQVKERRLRVGLSDKLLFKAGSTEFSKEALTILGRIADVLHKNPQFNIDIEGHTDNMPSRGRDFRDNWEYSILKANSIARALASEFGINPSQLTPSGKGEYQPHTSNETPEGRAANRRIELIIKPYRDEVVLLLRGYAEK